jgi:hypothetical protein
VTTYTYIRNIPASNHNPSVDQPDMRTNTNSTDTLIAEDHYSFGVANGGFHKQVRLPDLAAIGNLSARIANSGTLWTKKDISTGVTTESNLHFVPDIGTDDYQMTRTITGSYARFAVGTQYQAAAGVTPALFGGWTFLPGGLLLQYGTLAHTTNQETTITFPVPFSGTPFSINANGIIGAFDPNTRSAIGIRTVTTTSFVARTTTNNELQGIYWMAIGK